MKPIKTISIAALVTLALFSPSLAQQLDVPVIEYASDGLDTCSLGQVRGLKADGDGFLSVRTGPASSYRKIDEVYNGDRVWLFDQKGPWLGVVYGVNSVSCSPVSRNRPVPHKGKKGWIHKNWVQVIAG